MGKNERRKKRLDIHCSKFIKTVEVKNILHCFPKMPKGTKETIERKAVIEGNQAAAFDFYMKVTKADSDWYDYLMNALREEEYFDLLELLQDDDDDRRTSSSTKTVEQPVNFPRQEMNRNISVNAGQSQHPERDQTNRHQSMPQQASPPQSPQGASPPHSTQQASPPHSPQGASPPHSPQQASPPHSPQGASPPQSPKQASPPQSTQQASSRLPPELLTNTSQYIAKHQPGHPALDIEPQQSTPLSPEAYTRPGDDNRQGRESTRIFHQEPEEVTSVNELTLGKVHQGVRQVFNKLMNDNNDYPPNWKSLASKLNMTVDEVNSIQGAPQLYELLRTRGMRLVELVQLLKEMERADVVSEIERFYDLSDMDLPEQPVERLSPNVSRQTSKKTTKRMWEPPENKEKIKVKEIHKQQPDQIKMNSDEVKNIGKNVMNFEPEKQVKREPVVGRSSPANMVNPASRNDSKPMMVTPVKVSSSSANEEQLTMPYVDTSAPAPLKSVNQPPLDSCIELSGPFVLNSVANAPESMEDHVTENVEQNVEEMGDAHEKDDHEEEHQEEAENDVPKNSDSEVSPVASTSNASSESTMPSRARQFLSDGILALINMNRL
ncbi:uncharacterized protein LOC117105810 isoform X2 [Anneissia japonica]|uniref:uncharacterized protein LOC117105810 isoform X2 n=1 Tax=Anneissia japonica TaxID=1529436 RepID=UPI001425789F|nr:uncharacterized protein LOC117105810 isoform X2 [Anneissia japonica]